MPVRNNTPRRKATVTTAGVAINVNNMAVQQPEWINILYADNNRKAVYGTDYTVSVRADYQSFTFTPTQNLIDKLNNANGVSPTHTVIVERETPPTSDFSENDAAVRRSVRDAIDKIYLILQEHGADFSSLAQEDEGIVREINAITARAVRVRPDEIINVLPRAPQRANKIMAFDGDGDIELLEELPEILYSGQVATVATPANLPSASLNSGRMILILAAGGQPGATYPLMVVANGTDWRALNENSGYGSIGDAGLDLSLKTPLEVPGTMRFITTLTAHRTLVLPGSGLYNGVRRRIVREAGGAFNVLVKGDAGGATIATLPPTSPWVDMTYATAGGWFISAKGVLT